MFFNNTSIYSCSLAVYITHARYTSRPMKWTKRCKTCVGKFIELILKWALHFKCHYAFKLLLFTLEALALALALACSLVQGVAWVAVHFYLFVLVLFHFSFVYSHLLLSSSPNRLRLNAIPFFFARTILREVWTQIKWGKVFAKLCSVGNNNINQFFWKN